MPSLSFATLRRSRTRFRASYLKWCNSQSMSWFFPVLEAIRTAKQATKTIPIVIVTSQDPVATRLVDSLARPGGNITGITRLTRELSGNDWNCLRRRFQRSRASAYLELRGVLTSKTTRRRRSL